MRKFVLLACVITFNFLNLFSQTGRLVKDLYPGTKSSLNSTYELDPRIKAFKDRLIMVADDGTVGEELYQFDQSTNNISLIKDLKPNSKNLAKIYQITANENRFFFINNDGITGEELYTSDGTSAGTFMLKDINPNGNGVVNYASNFAITPSGIYFKGEDSNGRELWYSDGTTAGTKQVSDLIPGSSGSSPTYLCYSKSLNKLFFAANNSNFISQPFISDGTTKGTILLKDLTVNNLGSGPYRFTEFTNKVIFGANTNEINGKYVHEVFISDGTSTGTNSILSIQTSNFSSTFFDNFTVVGQKCFFSGTNSLYVTDGTVNGTKLLTDQLIIEDSDAFINLGNNIIFFAGDSKNGKELFISDGTVAGTKLLKDIVSGTASSYCFNFTLLKDKIYFIAEINLDLRELWVSNGTEAGTKRVFNFDSLGCTFMTNLTLLNNKLYFVGASDKYGAELYEYNPLITELDDYSPKKSFDLFPNPTNDKLYFNINKGSQVLEVLDFNGAICHEISINNDFIDISRLCSGIYFIKIKDSLGNISFSKIVKQ